MRFAARLLLLFALAPAIAGAAMPRARVLDTLLARMRERSGPVWSTHLASTSLVYHDGNPVPLRSDTQGIRFESFSCVSGLCQGTYFNGERLLAIDMNGTALPQPHGSDPYLRAERTIASLDFLAPDFQARGGAVYDDGLTAISGVRYRTLLVTSGDAPAMYVYVDPKSYAVRYVRDVNGDNTFEYRHYQRVGDLELPTDVYRNGSLFEHYETRTIEPAAFAAPHGPGATFVGGPVTVATDPREPTPVFACTFGGVAARCLLDSGNSGLSVSLALAERLKLPAVGSFRVRGLGDYATEVVRGDALQVGGMTLAPANYVVLHDIDRFGYDVVLGADMFAATTIELDPGTHHITFGAPAPTGGIAVPLAFSDFVPVLDVRLGTLPAQLALDTGDESSINLAYDFYQQHHDLFAATSERPVSGVGGSSVELLGTIPDVRIGALAIPSAVIGATRMLQGTAYGHVGAGLLKGYRVTIDYAAGELCFDVPPSPSPSPSPSAAPTRTP